MNTIVVNLIGGPGSGKSTLAAAVFAKLKMLGFKCEYVPEYIKGSVYEKNFTRLKNQLLIFSNQLFEISKLRDQIDIVVTDSPLVQSIYYGKLYESQFSAPEKVFNELVLSAHKTFDNLNYFLVRQHEYKFEGRTQTESEADQIAAKLEEILKQNGLPYKTLKTSEDCVNQIVLDVQNRWKQVADMSKSSPEIERKFFVEPSKKRPQCLKTFEIFTAYLPCVEHERRARMFDGKYYYCEKFGSGFMRYEQEKEISQDEFEKYVQQADRTIQKTRSLFALESGLVAEVDDYASAKLKSSTVEVEFPNKKSAEDFVPPDWFGDEITGQEKYSNAFLAKNI